jgi:type IV pilus assembly protein PilY1
MSCHLALLLDYLCPAWRVLQWLFDGNESSFENDVNTIRTHSYTPTVKALEAAVNWYRRDVDFTDSYNNTMESPIAGNAEDNWCRPNHIVLLSDGAPNSNSPTSGQRYGLTSWDGNSCVRNATSIYQNGRCAKEIATWAYTTDLETGAGWEVKDFENYNFDTEWSTNTHRNSVSIPCKD